MTEAVDGSGELGGDRRVDVAVVHVERTHRRLDLAGELLEHQVLVLHLGHEPCRLEQTLTVRERLWQCRVVGGAAGRAVGVVVVGRESWGWPAE